MKNISVGDKFYCIKDRTKSSSTDCPRTDKIINKSGKFYEVMNYSKSGDGNTIWMNNEENESYYYYLIRETDGHHYIFDEYFVDLPTMRKLKLKKINEGRR